MEWTTAFIGPLVSGIKWAWSNSFLMWWIITSPFYRMFRFGEKETELLATFALQRADHYNQYDRIELAIRTERLFRCRYIQSIPYRPFPHGAMFSSYQDLIRQSQLEAVWAHYHPTPAGMRKLWKAGIRQRETE